MKIKKQKGYVTLMMMIIIGALTAGIVYTIMSDSISSLQMGVSFSQTYKARSYANACAEEALFRIHNGDITAHEDNTSSPISFGTNETCTYDATVSGGNVTITVTGNAKRAIVSETVNGTVSGGAVHITSWQ
ncbi:MAG: hypothetical protein V4439_00190 [Patescibacteria group bacterium]